MNKRAFTIAEVLVVVAIFGLLVGVIGAVSVLVHRYSRQAVLVSEAQREAVSCMRAVGAELGRARCGTWESDSPQGGWFLSNRGPESEGPAPTFDSVTGEVLWRCWVGLWRDPDGEVRRAEIVLPGAGSPFSQVDVTTGPSSLLNFTVLPRRRILARKISRFRVQAEGSVCRVEIESLSSRVGNPPTRYYVLSSFLLH